MPHLPPDNVLIDLALSVAADRIATDPVLRDALSKRLLSIGSVDPDSVASRLLAIRDDRSAEARPNPTRPR